MSGITSLPEFEWPDTDVSQKQIVKMLNKYLAWKKTKMATAEERAACILPFESEFGLCTGINGYWGYSKLSYNEWVFIHQLEHILNWQPEQMTDSTAKEDPIIEDFLNAIATIHFGFKIRDSSSDVDLHKNIELITESNSDRLDDPEFEISFIFNGQELGDLLETVINGIETLKENSKFGDGLIDKGQRMIYLNDLDHSISLVYDNGHIYFYDTNSKSKPLLISDFDTLIEKIYQSFDRTNTSERMPIHMRVYRLEELNFNAKLNKLNQYIDPIEYCKDKLDDAELVADIVEHPEIQLMLARFNQHEVFEKLTRLGYSFSADEPHAAALLYKAIDHNSHETLFWMLANGFDVYSTHTINDIELSILEWAAILKKKEAITILLAFDYRLNDEEKDFLQDAFSPKELDDIFEHAINLSKRLLNLPSVLNLDRSSAREIAMFLRECYLLEQSGKNLNKIKVKKHDKTYTGLKALEAIVTSFKEKSSCDMYDFAERVEIYHLLKLFKRDHLRFSGSQKIWQLLGNIENQITGKKISQHTEQDFLEIGLVMAELQDLISKNKKSPRLVAEAKRIKSNIQNYLRHNGIESLDDYLEQIQERKGMRNYLFFFPKRENETKETNISFSKDVAPCLKYRD
jgi:hypothetical protein